MPSQLVSERLDADAVFVPDTITVRQRARLWISFTSGLNSPSPWTAVVAPYKGDATRAGLPYGREAALICLKTNDREQIAVRYTHSHKKVFHLTSLLAWGNFVGPATDL